MALEILNRALMLQRLRPRAEGAEIAAFAGLRVPLARIEAVKTGWQLADHRAAAFRRGEAKSFADDRSLHRLSPSDTALDFPFRAVRVSAACRTRQKSLSGRNLIDSAAGTD